MYIKKVTICFLLLLTISQADSQPLYKHYFDLKKFNLGFLMGMSYNRYNVKDYRNVTDEGVILREINLQPKAGINFGMITNLALHNNICLRFVPTVSLEQRDFEYRFIGSTADSFETRKIEASYFNMPLTFQFRTNYYDVYRAYVILGLQYGVNMSSNKKVIDDPNLLKIQKTDLSAVVGFGFTIYGERIKLSPEIRYSTGLQNIYVPEFTSHADAIRKLFSQVLTVNVNFE